MKAFNFGENIKLCMVCYSQFIHFQNVDKIVWICTLFVDNLKASTHQIRLSHAYENKHREIVFINTENLDLISTISDTNESRSGNELENVHRLK